LKVVLDFTGKSSSNIVWNLSIIQVKFYNPIDSSLRFSRISKVSFNWGEFLATTHLSSFPKGAELTKKGCNEVNWSEDSNSKLLTVKNHHQKLVVSK